MKNSIISKLLMVVFSVICIPFVIGNVVSYQMNKQEFIQQKVVATNELMTSAVYLLEDYLDDIKRIPVQIYQEDEIIEILTDSETYSSAQQSLLNEYLMLLLEKENTLRMIVLETDSDATTIEKIGYDTKKDWRETIYAIQDEGYTTIRTDKGIPNTLAYKTILIDIPSQDMLGSVTLYLTTDMLRQITENLLAKDGRAIVAIGYEDSPELFYQTSSFDQLETVEYHDNYNVGIINGVRGYVFKGKFLHHTDSMYIWKYVPIDDVMKPVNRSILQMTTVQVVFFLCILIFIAFVYRGILRPIIRISKNTMRVGDGEYNYTSTYKGKDEIGTLEKNYEEMVYKIEQLINKELKQEIQITKAQLKALQAQIHPHFLNNMLQMISTQAVKNGSKDVSIMLSMLARMFEYNMQMNQDFVHLEEELSHIQNYMELQKFRFRDRFTYSIVCNDEAKSMLVPKMMLQPLVENSFKHGFKERNQLNHISIVVSMLDSMQIIVTDNGKGLTDDEIKKICQAYDLHASIQDNISGIGIINVLERLYLYNQSFKWRIESSSYEETSIILEIPIYAGIEKRGE